MHTLNPNVARQTAGSSISERLRTDIVFLESRLQQMGGDGDCAYERALCQAYRQLLAERRQLLASVAEPARGRSAP
jgi:hypothetical protein